MTAETLAAAVLSWMTLILPPERYAAVQTYPEAHETAEERAARYQAIAADVAQVVLEEVAEPSARRPMAALLTAVAIRESGLAKDVDAPSCAPARVARGGCDGGRAKSLWQVHGPAPESRQDAARAALRLVRRSLHTCRRLPRGEQLSAYAAGTCTSTAGRRISRDRFDLARRLLAAPTPTP